jgi:hypothetical protein
MRAGERRTMKAIISVVILALAVTATAAAIPDPGSVSGYDAREISRAASPEAEGNPLTQLRAADARQARDDARKAAAKAAGVGLIYGGSNNQRAPDFWNYDPQTGERIANTSPGVSPEELAEFYGVPTVVVHDGGGFAWDNAAEGAAVGFGFAMILAALTLLIARSRRAVPAT